MPAKCGVFQKSTAAGPVDQAITGIGGTPKAIRMWTVGSTSLATFVADHYLSMGFVTGTTEQYALATSSDSGLFTGVDAARRIDAKTFIVIDFSGNVIAQAILKSFDSDGWTLTWEINNSSAYYIFYEVFYGSELTGAKIVRVAMPTSTGDFSIGGLSFQPEFAYFAHIGGIAGVPPQSSSVSSAFGLGAADGVGQWAFGLIEVTTNLDADTNHAGATDACIVTINNTPAIATKASWVSWDSGGVTLNFSVVSTTANNLIVLFLRGLKYKVGNFAKSTAAAPASQTVSGLGINPNIVTFAGLHVTGLAAAVDVRLGLGAYDGTNEVSASIESDNAGASEVDNISKNTKVFIQNSGNETITAEADGSSLGTGQFVLSWSTNDAVANIIFFVAFAPGATSVTPTKSAQYRVLATKISATKSALYRVRRGLTTLTKSAQYRVVTVKTVTKSAQYTVIKGILRLAQYHVFLAGKTKTQSSRYAVQGIHSKLLTARYTVGTYPDPDIGDSNKPMLGEQWQTCGRCGFDYPLSQLRIQPGFGGGFVVCIVHCYDDPSVEDLRPDELPTEEPLKFVDDAGPSL